MPGTPVTLTWWDDHEVGNQGYLILDGSDGSAGLDDTWLLTLDDTFQTEDAARFLGEDFGIMLTFYGGVIGAYQSVGFKASFSDSSSWRQAIGDAAILDFLANGVTGSVSDGPTWGPPPWGYGANAYGESFSWQWLGTEVDGGGGGEPHFVGFDGVRFDYQGVRGHWYTLMDCPVLTVSAEFSELRADQTVWEGTTFMTSMRIRIGNAHVTLDLADFPNRPVELSPEHTLNLDRGLVQPIATILGQPTGTWVRPFPGGQLCVTCLTYEGVKFLNLSVRLNGLSPRGLTGILGQTLQPKSKRVANDSFDESVTPGESA